MLQTTGCHRIVTQPSLSALTSAVKSTMEKEDYVVDLVELPALYDIFPSLAPQKIDHRITFAPYPLPLKSRQLDDLAIYMHTSGSTGLPKSIPWTERILLHWADSCRPYLSSPY